MTVENASYISQLDTTLPTAADLISEGDDHIRLTKTVLKTQFPNFGTTAITASAAEVNYSVGVTSAIQTQLNGKGAIAGQAWTGTHSFSGATSVPTLAAGTNTTGAASTAFVQADFLQKFPNYTAPVNASTTELNYLVGLTGAIQPQLSNQVAGPIHAATAKTTPADADELGIADSAASWALKKLTFTDLKAWITGLFVPRTGGSFGGGPDRGLVTFASAFGDGGSAANIALSASGTAQGQKAGVAFYPTFTGTTDNGPRRAADIWSSFSGTWGTERMSFGVGRGGSSANDAQLATLETLALTAAGEVLAVRGGLGYGAGAGGTVTQATSKSTDVTLNKPSGVITMNSASMPASTSVTFQLVSTAIQATSTLTVAILNTSVSSANNYRLESLSTSAGGAFLRLSNISGGALAESVQIHFNVHAGSTS